MWVKIYSMSMFVLLAHVISLIVVLVIIGVIVYLAMKVSKLKKRIQELESQQGNSRTGTPAP